MPLGVPSYLHHKSPMCSSLRRCCVFPTKPDEWQSFLDVNVACGGAEGSWTVTWVCLSGHGLTWETGQEKQFELLPFMRVSWRAEAPWHSAKTTACDLSGQGAS